MKKTLVLIIVLIMLMIPVSVYALQGNVTDSGSNSGDVKLTISPTSGFSGETLHIHAEAPGAESISLYMSTVLLMEQKGEVLDTDYICINYGEIHFSVTAAYNGGKSAVKSNEVIINLEKTKPNGIVYRSIGKSPEPSASVFSIDMPAVIAANESFRITINPQNGVSTFMVSIIGPSMNFLLQDERLASGIWEIGPLDAGEYDLTIVAEGGNFEHMELRFQVTESGHTEENSHFAPGVNNFHKSFEVDPYAAEEDFYGTWLITRGLFTWEDGTSDDVDFTSIGSPILIIEEKKATLLVWETYSVPTEFRNGRLNFTGDLGLFSDNYFEKTRDGSLILTEEDPTGSIIYIFEKDGHSFPVAQQKRETEDINDPLAGMIYTVDKDLQKGEEYYFGNGVEQDYEQALYWFTQSAEKGNAQAQCNLGIMYEYGQGTAQDYEKAVEWYQKAADQGNALAQTNLGVKYYWGKGTQQDLAKAAEWFQKAAEQGYADAQTNLGIMYHDGDGVDQDYEQAAFWYQKAAEQGNYTAQNNLGVMYQYGEGVDPDHQQALVWYQKSAEQGYLNAQTNLALLYLFGQDIELDYAKAALWLQKAAEQGDTTAQTLLGDMYENGYGVEQQDIEQALYWYRQAADAGFSYGQYALGCLYETGKGVEQDPEQAESWYRKAADQGNPDAEESLEYLHSNIRLVVSHKTIEVGKKLTVTVSAPGAKKIRLYDSLSSDPEAPRKEADGDTLEYQRIAVKSSGTEGVNYYAVAVYDGEKEEERSITQTVSFLPASKLRVNCPKTAKAGEELKITIYEVVNTKEYTVQIRDGSGKVVREETLSAGTFKLKPLDAGKYEVTVTCVGNESRSMTVSLEVS